MLHHGDCLQVLPALPEGSVDLVVTSPPYNLGINYRSFDDTAGRTEFLAWCLAWAAEVKRVLSDDGSFFLNVGAAPANPLMPHQIVLAFTEGPEPLFVLQNTFHWIKSVTVETRAGDQISAGHFKPINSKRFVNDCHEYIFHFSPAGRTRLDRRAVGVPYQDPSNIKRWAQAGSGLRCRGNTWFIPYETIQSRDRDRPHPASFPPKVPEQCVRLHGLERAGLMMDPFLGLGSSAIAAVRLGVDFIGVEMDEHYLREAVARVKAAAATA